MDTVSCRECGYEQDRGRFCGRCGTAVVDPAGREPSPHPPDPDHPPEPDGATSPAGTTTSSHRWVQVRRGAPALLLSAVAVVSLLVWFAGRPDGDPPAADDPAAADADDAAPAPEPPPPPAPPEAPEAPEHGGSAAGEEPDRPAEGFRDATGTVLLFDDGLDGALAVDLDGWERQRVALPGQRPGDQPFRLWRVGSWVVVGWGEIWAVAPGRPESARTLGQATVFLPAAEPDALWLIDYEGGSIGTGTSRWTLVDPSGTELAVVASAPAGLLPVRGVPGGLAVDGPDGTLVYDLGQDGLIDTPVGPSARVADVTRDRVAWCDGDPCERLVIVDGHGAVVTRVGSGETFEPSKVWLSPGGDRLVAGVRVQVGEGVDLRLRVYRADDGELLADTQLALGSLYGDWTVDGRQFFAWNHVPQPVGAPANLHRWAGGATIEKVAVGDYGIRGVYDFVAIPSQTVEEVFAPAHIGSEG